MSQGYPPVNAMGEQTLPLEFRQAYLCFHRVPWLAEPARLLDIDQPEWGAGFTQSFTRPDGLGQLIGTIGHEQQWFAPGGVLIDHQGTMSGEQFRFPSVKHTGAFTFRDDHARDPASFTEHRGQCCQGAVVVCRKQDAGHIIHLREHALAEGGVLVGLLVLAVFPRV